jgi:hypothetical protein
MDTTPQVPADPARSPVDVDELAATVRLLSAELERVQAELAELAELAEVRSASTPQPPGKGGPAELPPQDLVGRRHAIGTVGKLAAGAVAGAAAIVATGAQPAAAATVSGSGSPGVYGSGTPGVRAEGLNGDGLDASTNAAQKSAVYAHTSATGAFPLYALHGGKGVALHAESNNVAGTNYAAEVKSTGGGRGLFAQTNGGVAGYFSSNGYESTLSVLHGGAGQGIGLEVSSDATGIAVGPVGNTHPLTGISCSGYATAGSFYGTDTAFAASGTRATMILGTANMPPPLNTSVGYREGEIVHDSNFDVWFCIKSGTPGTHRKVTGPGTAGALHVLPAPVRVYDSRPGTSPTSVGPKGPLVAGTTRVIDLKVNSSKVPAGATAALITILLVNATSGNGNFTAWANGVARPQANTLVWGGSTGRFTAKELTAVDSQARIQVLASLKTDVVIDVVGYYR